MSDPPWCSSAVCGVRLSGKFLADLFQPARGTLLGQFGLAVDIEHEATKAPLTTALDWLKV